MTRSHALIRHPMHHSRGSNSTVTIGSRDVLGKKPGGKISFKLPKKLAQKLKSKMKGGATRTHTSNEEDYVGDDLKSGVTGSKLRVVVSKRVHPSIGQVKGFQFVYPGVISGAAGQSGFATLAQYGTLSQWTTASSNALAAGNTTLSQVPWFDLNPNRNTTGSGLYGFQAPFADRLILTKVVQVLTISNLENIPVDIELFYVKAKRDTNGLCTDELTNELGFMGLGATPMTYPPPGTNLGSAVGYEALTYPYMDYKDCPFTKTSWKLVKRCRVVLGPSAQRMMNVHITMNMLGDKQTMSQCNTTFIKGQCQLFARVVGGLIIDKTPAGLNLPTYATSRVGFLVNSKCFFKSCKAQGDRYPARVGVDYIPTGVAIANQQDINIVDGVAGVVQNL